MSKTKRRKQPEQSQPGNKLMRREGFIPKIVPKAISRVRADIDTWQKALKSADNIDRPRRARLYNLYRDILIDAHLTSQINLRMLHTLATPFNIKNPDGSNNKEITRLLSVASYATDITKQILWTPYYEHTLIDLTFKTGKLTAELIPRNNVVPEKGLILTKEDSDAGILFREDPWYGKAILEFWEKDDYGLLNKAIPHVLFKRFAQACWSELCEIYGIPPRFMKTNTQDPEMLDRAEAMLRDMGSAAYFIIDTTEEFEFARGADTNGDVYNNLITLCKSELSTLINGAVMGQDTKHGNESKEKSSIGLFDKIVQADKTMVTKYWNEQVLPALAHLGIVPFGLTYEYEKEEDLEKLWKMVSEVLPYIEVDPKWIKQKFGIEVTGMKKTGFEGLNAYQNFFD